MKIKELLNIKEDEILFLKNEDFRGSNFQKSDLRGSDFSWIKASIIFIDDKKVNLEKMIKEQMNNYLVEEE